MKKIMIAAMVLFLLVGCSSMKTETKKKTDPKDELNTFVTNYNKATETLEESTKIKIEKLSKDNFKELVKQNDDSGYRQVLDEGKSDDTTAGYEVTCLYDEDKNIIGYQSYGVGKLTESEEEGTVAFSDKGIVLGQVIATALDLDHAKVGDHFIKMMNEKELINDDSFEEKSYKISIHTDAKVGGVVYKFIKTK
ncbi:hypothetical protein M3685_21875 [Heyndrickxia oleronia]|uniref:hypothetical protein n=1 Tax=Heyndrickxia oleronia TaxID=38875 RepID=UPI002041FFC6|nr:hypothetical protein [Heyndrickxia oleronia]MCM3456552.1 hypothetical protein [Heyndrickxia oleronia]